MKIFHWNFGGNGIESVEYIEEYSYLTISNLTSEVRGQGWEEQPHLQGAGAAQAQEGWEELLNVQGQEGQPWGDTPCPR